MTAHAQDRRRGALRRIVLNRWVLLVPSLLGAALAVVAWASPADAAPRQEPGVIDEAVESCQEAIVQRNQEREELSEELDGTFGIDMGGIDALPPPIALPYHTYGDETLEAIAGAAGGLVNEAIAEAEWNGNPYTNSAFVRLQEFVEEDFFGVDDAYTSRDLVRDIRGFISDVISGTWFIITTGGDNPLTDRGTLIPTDRAYFYQDMCVPAGYRLVPCRNHNDILPDNIGIGVVSAFDPRWWLQEITVETNADDGNSCQLIHDPPTRTCEELRASGSYDAPGMIPDKCWGTYPTAHYEFSWNEGSNWDPGNWDDNLLGWMSSFMFGTAKGAMQAVMWLLDLGYTFDVGQFADAVTEIGARYKLLLVRPFHLEDIMMLFLVGWVAITALKGRLGLAGGELLTTLVLLTLATTLFTGRLDYFRSVVDTMDEASTALLLASQGVDPSTGQGLTAEFAESVGSAVSPGRDPDVADLAQSVGRAARDTHASVQAALVPLEQQFHRDFVELPHMYLNWGSSMTDSGGIDPDDPCIDTDDEGSECAEPCRRAAYHIIATGFDGEGWPQRHMERAGPDCLGAANFNRDADNARWFGAVLTLIVVGFVVLTLGITALTVLISKFLAAVLFAVTPFVILSAILPGMGRRLLWTWAGSVLQLIMVVIGSGGLLAMQCIGVQMVLDATASRSLIERWLLVLMVVATIWFARRKMTSTVQSLATSFSDNLTRLSPATATWSGGGPVGFDMDRMHRITTRAAGAAGRIGGGALMYGTMAGVGVGAGGFKVGANYLRDRRNARFGRNNLRNNRRHQAREAERERVEFEQVIPIGGGPGAPGTPPIPGHGGGGGTGGGAAPRGGRGAPVPNAPVTGAPPLAPVTSPPFVGGPGGGGPAGPPLNPHHPAQLVMRRTMSLARPETVGGQRRFENKVADFYGWRGPPQQPPGVRTRTLDQHRLPRQWRFWQWPRRFRDRERWGPLP